MSSLNEFRCEICGTVSKNPIHWFVIECTDQKLAVIKWDLAAAASPILSDHPKPATDYHLKTGQREWRPGH